MLTSSSLSQFADSFHAPRFNDFYFYNLVLQIADADRLLVSLGAVLFVSVIGFIIGPLGGNANPWLWKILDASFGFARKSYKRERSASSLRFRGVVFGLLYVAAATAAGFIFRYYLTRLYPSQPLEALFLSFTLTGGAVWLSLWKLHQALKEGSRLEKGSYRPIAVSTRNNLNTTDDFGIARVGIAYMPKVFDKALVAPLFWYLVGGLPLAYFYAGLACAVWALAKEGYAKNFGGFLVGLEKIFGFLPGLVSGFFLMLAALFTPGARLTRSVPSLFSKAKAKYAEGGFPVTVVAYALKISIGGPVEDLEGSVLRHGWVGPPGATAMIDKSHLKRVIYMSLMAYLLLVMALLVGFLFRKILVSA